MAKEDDRGSTIAVGRIFTVRVWVIVALSLCSISGFVSAATQHYQTSQEEMKKTSFRYKGSTYEYEEEFYDDGGYFYRIYLYIGDEEAEVFITAEGVSVDLYSSAGKYSRTIFTNITPTEKFPGTKTLNEKQLMDILDVLWATNISGQTFTEQEMKKLYQEWLQTKP